MSIQRDAEIRAQWQILERSQNEKTQRIAGIWDNSHVVCVGNIGINLNSQQGLLLESAVLFAMGFNEGMREDVFASSYFRKS